MQFDARAAKLLKPGEHMTIADHPGLRLECTASRRAWIYRYKSPVDGRMKQTKIGAWPAMSPAAAIVEWEKLRAARDSGRDVAAEKRTARTNARAVENGSLPHAGPYTVRRLCADYLVGHVERNRALKGAKEIRRMFDTMLAPIAGMLPEEVTRAIAFDLLNSFAHIPVQAAKLRSELGAAWDYSLDAGRLREDTPNWWRQIMRGRLRSNGKKIQGKAVGQVKRVLAEAEVGELIRWLPNFSRIVDDALVMYLWTGTRGSEIASMEAAEIAEEKDGLWWTIPKSKTKNARRPGATDLRVPLFGRAAQIVRRRLAVAGDGYLFPARVGGPIEQKVIQTAVHYHQPYSKTRPEDQRPRLTITHWAPHDLRRTTRTLLASMGCPNDVAESILGHMLPGVQGVYNRHTYDRERHEWMGKLSVKLESLASDGGADFVTKD
ncbi:integrase family protein [Cupriavidus sp. KK10]|jgi:integrase|uniref:tyrosine-type recombinase/integrase n=1 Tax=Cupriavidus sp. KK10 TaxID=1478019 RepID=UPI001BAA0CCE|nr:integrase family protein [Cupriavidus sp. KK10]QUN29509.1 integrase family protein [Cupriavidus sp. KK10]